jgi:hypothetical protein
MTAMPTMTLGELYLADETAWLEAMAALVADGRMDDLDRDNLLDYLTSMAKRDRKELTSNLVVLMAHLLKWQYQPEKRTRSWLTTIRDKQFDIEFDIQGGTPRNHAHATLGAAYVRAVHKAADETELPEETFPAECPFTLESALSWRPEPGHGLY